MAVTAENFERAKQIHNRLQMKLNSLVESKGMTPDNPEYLAAAEDFGKFDKALRDYTSSQRKVDDNGRLTEEPPSALPAPTEDGPEATDEGYFYEPNVGEVQDFFRRNPQALDRLGLRDWVKGISQQEKREPVLDPMSGAPQGWNVVPARTHLDDLTEEQSAYKAGTDEMFKVKSEEARKRGVNLRRYRDVLFKPGQKIDYLSGGAGKIGERIVAPALMGVADAATLGQAAPLGDALTDLIDYEAGKRGYDIGPQPKARDVIARSKPAYVAGNFAGYGLPRNPANLIQGQLAGIGESLAQRAVGEAAKGTVGRAAAATAAGGLTSAFEGAVQDFANAANEGASYEDSSKAAFDNLGMNAALGGTLGGGFDAGASGINSLRQAYRGTPRNAPLRTLEAAGGGAHLGKGVTAPDEIKEYYRQSNEVGAHGTAGDRAARAVAPDIDESITRQADDEQARIERETNEYYNHPAYRDIEHSVKPAVQALTDLMGGSFGRSAVDGARIPADPPMLKKVGSILSDYAQPTAIPAADAPKWAADTDGIVIEGELANHLFGEDLGIKPGQVALLRPIKVNAQGLTAMEGRIDRELGFSANRGDPKDPAWNRFNRGIKETRDQFPLYRDEGGNLVAPPPESARQEPFPMDPEAVARQEEMRVLPPPERVSGGPQRKPEGLMAVGPGQPDLPSSPFDPRAGIKPGVAADQLPRPIGIGGEGMVARPEGLYAVGPEGNPIPDNPFDPRAARTSAEAIRPMMQQSITGGEMAVPQSLDPNARMGIGPRDNQGPVQSFTPEGLPLPGEKASRQPTVEVQGDYNKPPMVEQEKAPITERGMPPAKEFRIMVMENGQPRPVAGMRVANSPEEAKSMVDTLNSYGTDEFVAEPIAGPAAQGDLTAAIKQATDQNGLAPVADVVRAFGGDVEKAHKAILDAEARGAIELRPEGGLNRLSKEELAMTIPGPDGMRLSNIRVIDEAPKDSRSPLERSLDERLGSPDAPPVPRTEIEEAGARQTADREEVAQNQKAYVEDIFSPGREARAREMEKFKVLAENPEVVQEAIEAVKKVDERLGPIPLDEKRKMVVKMIENKLGRPIDVEDLIRAGLIGSGLVQIITDEDGGGEGATIAGMGFFGRGKGRKGRRSETPGGPSSIMVDLKGPSRPSKPQQLKGKTSDGKPVEGFSALRAGQHDRLTAIEKAKQRIGVGKDQTVEDRIRTFGQQEGRMGTDDTLLAEAKKIGKEKELRTAAGAAVYPHMKARAQGGSGEGAWKQTVDFFGLRGYRLGELLAGRFDDKNLRNPFVRPAASESPFWSKPETYVERIQQSLLEDPTRRLIDMSRGAQGGRHGDDLRRIIEALQGDEYYEENRQQPTR